jgi:hypothetical protein
LRAAEAKERIYHGQAVFIHSMVRGKLPHFMKVKTKGGVAWGMGEQNFCDLPQYKLLISELGKEITEAVNVDPVW